MKKLLLWGGIALVALAIIFLISNAGTTKADLTALKNYDGKAIVYKSDSCGCCDLYVGHLNGNTKTNVEIIDSSDSSSIKEEMGIPSELQSCHTTVIGNYFVEGHVPLEAVSKLLKEQPNIAGIALPGMPSGAPGMTGPKTEPFIIYAVGFDGKYGEFMRI